MDTVDWNSLPSLALHQVFVYLPPESRVAASSTCKHWRTALYHPLFWHRLTIDIPSPDILHLDARSKVNYVNATNVITLVKNIWLTFDSRSRECIALATSVVKALLDNELVKNIDIELDRCDLPKNAHFQDDPIPIPILILIHRNVEPAVLKVLQKGNIEGFSFRYSNFFNWQSLINTLAKGSAHSLRRLEFSGLQPTLNPDPVKISSTFASMSSLINLQRLSLDLNPITCELLPALCSMPQLKILVLHVYEDLDKEIDNDIWENLRIYNPKLELRLTIINCNAVAKNLHTKLLRPSMPLTHLKVLFCCEINVPVLTILLEYRHTLQSLIWVDEDAINPYDLIKAPTSHNLRDENITNPLIILSWLCKRLTEIVIIGYFSDPMDVCGIARLRGSNLKVFDVLEDDICFNRSTRSMPYHEVVMDVSNSMNINWKPLTKDNIFLNTYHFIKQRTSKDLTTKLDYETTY